MVEFSPIALAPWDQEQSRHNAPWMFKMPHKLKLNSDMIYVHFATLNWKLGHFELASLTIFDDL